MRKIRLFGLVLAAALVTGAAAPAHAAKCNTPPPSWWYAPKVTYTYSGSGYASSHSTSHTFSAQRRSGATRHVSSPSRYRDRHERW